MCTSTMTVTRGPGPGPGRGFTLIELLVVVAIIALLISILLPSLSKARETARMVACQALMKQYLTANVMYANESEQRFVPVKTAHGTRGSSYYWWGGSGHFPTYRAMLGLRATGSFPESYLCPSIQEGFRNYGRNYAYNHQNFNPGGSGAWALERIIHAAKVPTPASRLQMVEHNDWHVSMGYGDPSRWERWGPLRDFEGGGKSVQYRHLEMVNVGHFDGHVSVYTKAEAYPKSSSVRKRLWYVYQ